MKKTSKVEIKGIYTPWVKGVILSKSVSPIGTPYGSISGTDNTAYHFNTKALSNDYPWDLVNVGDSVRFHAEQMPDGRPIARDIQLVEPINAVKAEEPEYSEIEDDPAISFYRSGLSKNIDEERLDYYLNSLEKDVINKIKRVLYVTSVNHHNLGHSVISYPFCLVGATKNIKKYVRGQYEFLLVFSYFENADWQMNTLKVAKAIRKRREVSDRRPLANFYMLISNARTLLTEVRKTKGGTDAAVIPFTFDEILGCLSEESLIKLVNERFEEFYFANNMFGETSPIEEDTLLFGDRGKIADAIVQRCIEGKHSGIFGLRRSGKSSVLRAVERRLDNQGIKHTTIESRSMLENVSSWRTALYDIARQICITCSGKTQKDDETRSEFDKKIYLNSTEEDYQRRPTQCFVEDVKKYTRDEQAFVLAIDEIELITYNTATSEEWKKLDAYKGFWGALRDSGCSLIVSGVNSTINEKSIIEYRGQTCDNPMYERIHNCSGFSQTYLPVFTDEQTKHMINTLGSYSNIGFDNVYVDINRAFGGQPYAIRQFCAFVYERVKSYCKTTAVYQLTRASFEALVAEFIRSAKGEDLVKTILQHITIYEDEYRMLKKIALAPEKYRAVDSESIALIDHLVKYGIIEYDSDTSYISFNIASIKDYIRKNEEKELEDMDNDERRQYIQNHVAECEKKLKRYILNCFTYGGISEQDARNIMTSINTSTKKCSIDVNTCELSDFFDHKRYVVYFSDLRTIISNNWSNFRSGFDKVNIDRNHFLVYMTDLNAGRTDADHYDAEDLTVYPKDWEIDQQTVASFKNANNAIKRFFEKNSLMN